MALIGCIHCGLVLEEETKLNNGHQTGHSCPECSQPLRVVGLNEANQLTKERFLATHWREIAAARGASR
jgi:hypothetical protein